MELSGQPEMFPFEWFPVRQVEKRDSSNTLSGDILYLNIVRTVIGYAHIPPIATPNSALTESWG